MPSLWDQWTKRGRANLKGRLRNISKYGIMAKTPEEAARVYQGLVLIEGSPCETSQVTCATSDLPQHKSSKDIRLGMKRYSCSGCMGVSPATVTPAAPAVVASPTTAAVVATSAAATQAVKTSPFVVGKYHIGVQGFGQEEKASWTKLVLLGLATWVGYKLVKKSSRRYRRG